jgi:hypothetical protein
VASDPTTAGRSDDDVFDGFLDGLVLYKTGDCDRLPECVVRVLRYVTAAVSPPLVCWLLATADGECGLFYDGHTRRDVAATMVYVQRPGRATSLAEFESRMRPDDVMSVYWERPPTDSGPA